MKLAIDVFYKEQTAKIVAAVFNNWEDEQPHQIIVKYKSDILDYVPGEFFKRELPCLTEIISDFDISKIELIIIDGYVYLDDNKKLGLGAHLYQYLDGKLPIIGVAKTKFHNNTVNVKEVFRGTSKVPLFITAIGVDINDAAENIKNMYGENRMPKILKAIDTETKK